MSTKIGNLPAFIGWLLLAGLTASPAFSEGEFLSSLEKEVTGLVAAVKPSLVTIHTRRILSPQAASAFQKSSQTKGAKPAEYLSRIGSGVILDQDGYVITSASVVAGGNDFEVILTDGRRLKGDLVGAASDLNLAVLKVSGDNLTPARLGNSDQLKAGSWVTILGNSYGLPTAVAVGLVNGIRPDGFLQMSASVAPGNSGAPVLNSRGEVVGLVLAKISEPSSISMITEETRSGVKVVNSQGRIEFPSASVSLAIPMNRVKRAADQLIKATNIKRGFLGVYLEDRAGTEGVLITEVVKESPAARAGLRPGDILMSISGKEVRKSEEVRMLVEETPPQSIIPMRILRNDNLETTSAQVGTAPAVFIPSTEFVDWGLVLPGESTPNRTAQRRVSSASQVSSHVVPQTELAELRQLLQEAKKQLAESRKGSEVASPNQFEARLTQLQVELDAYKKEVEELKETIQELKESDSGQP